MILRWGTFRKGFVAVHFDASWIWLWLGSRLDYQCYSRRESGHVKKEPTKGNVALPHNGEDPRHGVEQGVRGDSPLGQQSRELGHESSGAISLFSGNSLYLHTDFYFQLFCKQSFLSLSFFCKQNLFVTFTLSKQSSFACLYFCHFFYKQIFIRPRFDHSLPMSETNWLTNKLVETWCHDLVEN